MIELQHVADYLSNAVTDPFQRYILKKEIYREEPTAFDTKAIHSSKWYNKLINEQWEDGSWGRFHSMDSTKICYNRSRAETSKGSQANKG